MIWRVPSTDPPANSAENSVDSNEIPPSLRADPSPRRRLFLKFALLFAIVVAAGLALRPVVPWIAELGLPDSSGTAGNGLQTDFRHEPDWLTAVVYAGSDSTAGRLEWNRGGSITHIRLPNGGAIDDRWMSNLHSLQRLQIVDLANTSVTDVGARSLCGLPELAELYLDGSKITGFVISIPGGFPSLKVLSLNSCPVDDKGLESICTIPSLEVLNLRGTQITDAGLPSLDGLQNLQQLNIGQTKVTAQGVQQLRSFLPRCTIVP